MTTPEHPLHPSPGGVTKHQRQQCTTEVLERLTFSKVSQNCVEEAARASALETDSHIAADCTAACRDRELLEPHLE